MNVFELFAKLSLDTKEYESGLNDAKTKGQKWASGIATGVKVGAAAVAAVGTAAISAGTKFMESAQDVAEYGDHIDKMSQKIGISAEAYQEWDAIMQHTGASIDSLAPAMKTLATQAQTGNEAFQKLGISEAEVASLSSEDLFAKVISGLQDMGESTERTYLASQLLGRGATELGALLNTSAEETENMRQRVHELGGVMSDEAVKAAAKYQDTLQDLQTSLQGVKRNLMSDFLPSITTVMEGLTEIFSQNTDEGLDLITEGINDVITEVTEKLPVVLEIVSTTLEAIVKAIVDNLPKIIESCVHVILELAKAIVENLPTIVDAVLKGIIMIIKAIGEALPELIPTIVQAIMLVVETLLDNLPLLLDAVLQLMQGLAEGILNALPIIIQELPKIIEGIVNFFMGAIPQIIDAGIQLLMALIAALPEIIDAIVEALPQIIDGIVNGLLSNIDKIIEAGVTLLIALVENLPKIIVEIVKAIPKIIVAIVKAFGEGVVKIAEVGVELIKGLWEGIKSMATWIWDKISGFFSDIWEGIKSFFGIKSPSRKMKWISQMMMEGLAGGFDEYGDKAISAAEDINACILDSFGGTKGYEIPVSAYGDSDMFSASYPNADEEEETYVDAFGNASRVRFGEDENSRNMTVILELDRVELGRVVYKLNEEETQRVGVRLAGGIA